MTHNDAYRYARQLRRWKHRSKIGPYCLGMHAVHTAMMGEGYTEEDFNKVRAWLKSWTTFRNYRSLL